MKLEHSAPSSMKMPQPSWVGAKQDDVLRGKGYGKTLLKLAIDYARDILHAKRITLGVLCDNHSAFECYRSLGFTVIDNDSYMIDGEERR